MMLRVQGPFAGSMPHPQCLTSLPPGCATLSRPLQLHFTWKCAPPTNYLSLSLFLRRVSCFWPSSQGESIDTRSMRK